MESSSRRNLMLSSVDVILIGYSGTTVAHLSRRLSGNVIRVNRHLRQLVAELSVNTIRLWRQRRGLCNPRSVIFGRDSVQVDQHHRQVLL